MDYKKIIFFSVLITVQLSAFCQKTSESSVLPFILKTIRYDSLVAFDCKPSVVPGFIIFEKGNDREILNKALINKRKKLGSSEIDTLNKLFLNKLKNTGLTQTPKCYLNSILGFIYYHNGLPEAYFTIPDNDECTIITIFKIFRKSNGGYEVPEYSMLYTSYDKKKLYAFLKKKF